MKTQPAEPGAIAATPLFAAHRELLARLLADPTRPPQALLVTGAPGIGKGAFAFAIAASVLCETPREQRATPGATSAAIATNTALACGRCPSCHWLATGSHPDLRIVELMAREEGKLASELSIEQIRDLADFAGMTAFRGGARVVVVDPAELLGTAAANALLKRLEEPGDGSLFLLVTHQPDRLPATVRSRLRTVRLASPTPAEAGAWLAQATGLPAADAVRLLGFVGGAPLHARDLADPAKLTAYRSLLAAIEALPDTEEVIVADRIGAMQAAHWFPVLQRWIGDLIRVAAGAQPRFFPESAPRLAQLAARSSLAAMTEAAMRLAQLASVVRHPLNPRLFLESALAVVRDAFGVDRRPQGRPGRMVGT